MRHVNPSVDLEDEYSGLVQINFNHENDQDDISAEFNGPPAAEKVEIKKSSKEDFMG